MSVFINYKRKRPRLKDVALLNGSLIYSKLHLIKLSRETNGHFSDLRDERSL